MKPVAFFLSLLLALPALDAMADGGTLARIRESGVIRLGYLETASPFSKATANGPEGYSIDLCGRVVQSLREQMKLPGLRAEWVKVTRQDRIDAVRGNRIDLECGTTTWTLARQEGVDFSLMTFVDGGSLLVQADGGPRRLAEFGDKRIAVVKGTTTESALERELKRRSIGARLVTVKDEGEGMKLLASGKADAYASDRLVLMGLAINSPGSGTYRLLDEDFSLESYALVLRRDDHDFRLAVNRALAQVFRSGDIFKIYDKWLGALGRPGVLLSALYVLQAVAE